MNIYGDEEIVKILNQYKKVSIGDVYSGIKINGDLYHFHEYQFMDGQIKIMLPLRFIDMPEEIAKVKYGHMSAPDMLKCSRDYNIDIMMSFTEEELNDNELEKKLDEQIELLKMIQPSYEIYEKNIENNEYVKIAWFDYRASAIDIALYCMNFIFIVNGRMVIGKFTCNIYRAESWKPVILQMLYSINNQNKTRREVMF